MPIPKAIYKEAVNNKISKKDRLTYCGNNDMTLPAFPIRLRPLFVYLV